MLKKVIAVQDDSGHWYIIPAELESEFNRMVDCADDDYEAQEKFMEKFDQYRTGGDLNSTKLYADL
jgi:hypothetical protein